MRLNWVFAGALLALAPVGALAAETRNIIDVKVGEVVYDREGGTVATVRRVGEDDAVVDTGSAKVTLGLDSFRRRDGKLVLPMNRAALGRPSAEAWVRAHAVMCAERTASTSVPPAAHTLNETES